MSYTTINIKIHTIKCCKFNGYGIVLTHCGMTSIKFIASQARTIFQSDFSPYIKNDVHIMRSHIVSTLKAHDL